MLSLPPDWMNWTSPTLLFLGSIILLLTSLTIWDMKEPGWARQGLLPISTTRGDRFFMGLLMTGGIFCLWLYFVGPTAVWAVLLLGILSIIGTISFF
jgi:Predicted small integral membrane protein